MIDVYDFHISPYVISHLVLQWKIKNTFEHLNEWVFKIYRAQTPSGPWEQLGMVINHTEFRDMEVNLLSKHREYYYRLDYRNTKSHKEASVGPIQLFPKADLLALEMVRLNNILLKGFIGRPAWVLKMKTYGERCDHCWDRVKAAVINSHCLYCYRVGFTGGYDYPLSARINTSPSTDMVQLSELGEIQSGERPMWMSNDPILSPRDLIIFADTYKRYRVVNPTWTEKLGVPVHQLFTAVEISPTDIEYMIPLVDEGIIPIIRRVAVYKDQEVEDFAGGSIPLKHISDKREGEVFLNGSKMLRKDWDVVDGQLVWPNGEPAIGSYLSIVATVIETPVAP
jgi:hypothetical protein